MPFFNDLLSLIASVFDSWFCFIMWSAAWYEIYSGQRLKGPLRIWENIVAAGTSPRARSLLTAESNPSSLTRRRFERILPLWRGHVRVRSVHH